jgi:hypothetical protein
MNNWSAKEIISVSFLYCPLVNSKWFKANFLRDLQEEINMLRDKYVNTEILIMEKFNCRMGEEQIKLPHLFDFREDWMVDKDTFSEKRYSKDKSCNGEEKKLTEFCEFNNSEILNGKFGLDVRAEFTFINKQGSNVIDYTLASEGILRHIVDFKIRIEVISTPMPWLVELDNIVEGINNLINRVSNTKSQDLIQVE